MDERERKLALVEAALSDERGNNLALLGQVDEMQKERDDARSELVAQVRTQCHLECIEERERELCRMRRRN